MSSNDRSDTDGRTHIGDNLRDIAKEMEQLEAIMREFRQPATPEVVTPRPASTTLVSGSASASQMVPIVPELDWPSLVRVAAAASSVADDWHTCPSDVTSADEYFSADESAATSRRSSGNNNPAQRAAPQASTAVAPLATSGLATSRQSLPEARRSFFTTGPVGAPQPQWQEIARSSQVQETSVSRVFGSDGQQSLTVSKQQSSQEWRGGVPTASSSSKDTSTVTTNLTSGAGGRLPLDDPRQLRQLPAPLSGATALVVTALVVTPTNSPEPEVHVLNVSRDSDDVGVGGTVVAKPLLERMEKSKEWLQLKILEMEPDLAKIGTSADEAVEYQRQHEDVLMKLQPYLPEKFLLDGDKTSSTVPVGV